MPLALIISLEKEITALAVYTKAASGKAGPGESDRLDSAARICGVAAITSLLSESPAALIEQLKSEGFDPAKMRLPPEQWFSPDDGIENRCGLSAHVTANLNNFKQPNPIIRDLEHRITVGRGQAAGIKFHFTKTNL